MLVQLTLTLAGYYRAIIVTQFTQSHRTKGSLRTYIFIIEVMPKYQCCENVNEFSLTTSYSGIDNDFSGLALR